jgi:PDDEXK-like uncharacterized protein DUF3799
MTAVVEAVELTEITEPGVYSMPEPIYHADPVPVGSLSSSGARLLLPPSTPAHFRYRRDHPTVGTRAMEVGSGTHTIVLGDGPPVERIDADDWRTKSAKEDAAAARAAGRIPLLAAEHDAAHAMAEVVRNHETAGALFAPGSGLPEQNLFWQDPDTQVWCRCRLDWLPHPGAEVMYAADYKTAVEADLEHASKAMANYGYHQQAQWNAEGLRLLGLAERVVFLFVFQEKTPPYEISVVQPNEDALAIAAERNRKAIDVFRQCMEADHWPGYPTGVTTVALPGWSIYQHERDAEAGAFDIEENR